VWGDGFRVICRDAFSALALLGHRRATSSAC
jgi:hypothetical protein